MRHRAGQTEYTPSRRLKVGVGAATVLLIAAFVIAAFISGVSGGRDVTVPVATAATSSATPTGRSTPAAESVELYVHVVGAVNRPGLIRVAVGARVIDAIEAAGGVADGADPAGVNLARPVQDGELLRVPLIGESVEALHEGSDSGADGGITGEVINVNTATSDQLQSLPRIGPALAQRIIDWRLANGRFATTTDLLNVTGVGQKVFDGLKDRVRV